jgi:hypothetical protein
MNELIVDCVRTGDRLPFDLVTRRLNAVARYLKLPYTMRSDASTAAMLRVASDDARSRRMRRKGCSNRSAFAMDLFDPHQIVAISRVADAQRSAAFDIMRIAVSLLSSAASKSRAIP